MSIENNIQKPNINEENIIRVDRVEGFPVSHEYNEEFEKYSNLSPEQKQYIDLVNKLKEKGQDKDKEYSDNRGFVFVGNSKLDLDEFVKDPTNFDQLDFSLISNIQNLDLMIGRIPSDKIYLALDSLKNDTAMIEKIGCLQPEVKKKFIDSLPSNYKQALNEKHRESIYSNISNRDEILSFMYAIRSMNLPLSEKMNPSRDSYFKSISESRDSFLKKFNIEMEKYGPFAVNRIFETSELKQLFRATDYKLLPREQVIQMTKDVIKKYGDLKRTDMQPKIIDSVLNLKRENIINEKEADNMLAI